MSGFFCSRMVNRNPGDDLLHNLSPFAQSSMSRVHKHMIKTRSSPLHAIAPAGNSEFISYRAKWRFIGAFWNAFTLLTSRFKKSRHLDPTIYTCAKNRKVSVFFFPRNFSCNFLVGSAHVRSQATVHAFMHAVCMRAEDIDTRFKECA